MPDGKHDRKFGPCLAAVCVACKFSISLAGLRQLFPVKVSFLCVCVFPSQYNGRSEREISWRRINKTNIIQYTVQSEMATVHGAAGL